MTTFEQIFKTIGLKFAEQAEPSVLVLTLVVFLLAWLLMKSLGRVDELSKELSRNSQVMAQLTELLNHLVYGRKK
jgi:hypothetical protein